MTPGDFSDMPLFALPSGPQTSVPSRRANSLAAYRVWRRSEEGGRVFGWMLQRSRRALAAGRKRVTTKGLFEAYRELAADEESDLIPADLNNSWTGYLADELVAADARLLPLIERRVRRKAQA